MLLQGIDAIPRKMNVLVSIFQVEPGFAQRLYPDLRFGVHGEMASHCVNAQLTEGVTRRWRFHLVIPVGIPDRCGAACKTEKNLTRLLAPNHRIQPAQVREDLIDLAQEETERIDEM